MTKVVAKPPAGPGTKSPARPDGQSPAKAPQGRPAARPQAPGGNRPQAPGGNRPEVAGGNRPIDRAKATALGQRKAGALASAGSVAAGAAAATARADAAAATARADAAAATARAAAARTRGLPGLGRAPVTLALSCVGVLLVALAYARGRTNQAWAVELYWTGQAVVFAPVALRLLARRIAGFGEAFTLAIGLAVNQYLLKWLYSPDQFRFPDELQHWGATTTLVRTGALFQPNFSLPPAVHFPGLEEMGAAVVSLTGLPVTAAGLLVAGIAHLTLVGTLFLLAQRAGAGPAVAGLTCVVYATGVHYLFFDSSYLYQTAALPFLVLALWAARRWRLREPATLPFGVIGLVAIIVTVVSHHVTAMIMVGTLGLIAACEILAGRRPRRWSTAILALAAAAILAAWIAFVAPDVLSYLGAPMATMVEQGRHLLDGGSSSGPKEAGSPLWELALQAAGLLLLLAILLRSAYTVVRYRRRNAWRLALLAGGMLFFVGSAVRFVGDQGPELAGRAATFTYLPMSMIVAGALGQARISNRLWGWLRLTRWISWRAVAGAPVLALLLVTARIGGWPPLWEQLPGPYLVSAYERSTDAAGVDAAKWLGRRLAPGGRIAADSTGWTLASTYGRQDPVGAAAPMYYAATWDATANGLRWSLAVRYVWVDLRTARQTPKSGSYFPEDPQANTHRAPLARANLDKFNTISGASRIYDSGTIQIYDLGRPS